MTWSERQEARTGAEILVSVFFSEYRDHFNRLDGRGIARLWHAPSGVMEGTQVVWFDDADEIRRNHIALCERYRKTEFGSADFSVLRVVTMGENATFAHVWWTLRRSDGSVWRKFGTGYHLVHFEDHTEIVLAVAHEGVGGEG